MFRAIGFTQRAVCLILRNICEVWHRVRGKSDVSDKLSTLEKLSIRLNFDIGMSLNIKIDDSYNFPIR